MGKAAITNMVQWLAQELMDYNIRVNAVGPGVTRTNMMDSMSKVAAKLPPKSIAYPSQIASVVAMICSKDGNFVNGETFLLTGGYRL